MYSPINSLRKRRFNRHPGEGRGPRPAQVIDYAEGVGTGLRRCGGKFELFRDSLKHLKRFQVALERVESKTDELIIRMGHLEVATASTK